MDKTTNKIVILLPVHGKIIILPNVIKKIHNSVRTLRPYLGCINIIYWEKYTKT